MTVMIYSLFLPTQCRKTDIFQKFIMKRQIHNNYIDDDDDVNIIKQFDIIISSNNTAEVRQTKSRIKKTTDMSGEKYSFIVEDLTSKSTDNRRVNGVIAKQVVDEGEFINILTMCANKTRLNDLIKILKAIRNVITKVRVNITYDEPDSYEALACSSINTIINEYSDVVDSITLVTATPKTILDKLESSGIVDFTNIIHGKSEQIELGDYVSFKKHDYHIDDTNLKNPVEFAEKYITESGLNKEEGVCLFAPATRRTNGHDDMQKMLNKQGFNVFFMNGHFKGFIFTDGTVMTLDFYKKKYDIKSDEIRDTIRHFRNKHKKNFAITGHLLVERGITLFTTDSHPTHMILSDYFTRDTKRLIQIAGRCTGMKAYTGPVKVCCSSDIKRILLDYVKDMESLIIEDKEIVNSGDFSEYKKTAKVKGKGKYEFNYLVSADINEIKKFAKDNYGSKVNPKKIVPATFGTKVSSQVIINRKWGLDEDVKCRVVYSDLEDKWVVYGKKS